MNRFLVVILVGAGFFLLYNFVFAQQATPQVDFLGTLGLKEGDVVGSEDLGDPDIFIVNEYGYKRLFLNPKIFSLYGHLSGGYAGVKKLAADLIYLLPTSGLFRNCETQENKVYALEVSDEDAGILHWVNISGTDAVAGDPDFFKRVFCINMAEFSLYSAGSSYTAMSQIPTYVRSVPSFDPPVISEAYLNTKKITYSETTWRSYSNTEYKFSFKYPDVWQEKKLGTLGVFLGADLSGLEQGIVPDVSAVIMENLEKKSPKDFLGQLTASGTGRTFEASGISGYVIESYYGYSLAIPLGGRMFLMSGITWAGMANFNSIINSLRIP